MQIKTQDKQILKLSLRQSRHKQERKADSSKDENLPKKHKAPKKQNLRLKKTRAKKADFTNATKSKASRTKTINLT